MPPLFDETKNAFFHTLCSLVNAICAGQNFTRAQILQQLQNSFASIESDERRENELIDAIFTFDANGVARLALTIPLPVRATSVELQWLRTFLDDEAAAFLLSTALREKLRQQLHDVPPLAEKSFWHQLHQTGDNPAAKPQQTFLHTFQTALLYRRQIHYINQDAHGCLHEDDAAPIRLEYDLYTNRYRFIVWNMQENRAIKINLASIQSLVIKPIPIPSGLTDRFTAFLQQRQSTVTLRLTRRNNAVERCFFLFSFYDKESYLENANAYRLHIHFYDFDRQEILRKILSLGPAVTILEPASLRKNVIDCLRAAEPYYTSSINPT